MRVIDSHTGGQPTRVIVEGGPDLGTGTVAEKLIRLQRSYGDLRLMTVLEPKCADAMVGALLCEPANPKCSTGVIFYNMAGYLGMCGHGLMGVMVTLAYLGHIKPGQHLIETPVGLVRAALLNDHEVRIHNVESYRFKDSVNVDVAGLGPVSGDIAWGGNWFFLADAAPCAITFGNIPALTIAAMSVRRALNSAGMIGEGGAEIDHIEFFETPETPETPEAGGAGGAGGADSRSFVLCPGSAYDRSPCGTGTSAKLACLAADGKLMPGEVWVQESVIGSRFKSEYSESDKPGRIFPCITGQAFVHTDAKLILNSSDPFLRGIS